MKNITWYSVIKTKGNSLCEDLFDAKMTVENVDMSFAKIKTISVINI